MIKYHDAKRRIEFRKLKNDIGADQFEGDGDDNSDRNISSAESS